MRCLILFLHMLYVWAERMEWLKTAPRPWWLQSVVKSLVLTWHESRVLCFGPIRSAADIIKCSLKIVSLKWEREREWGEKKAVDGEFHLGDNIEINSTPCQFLYRVGDAWMLLNSYTELTLSGLLGYTFNEIVSTQKGLIVGVLVLSEESSG